MENESSGRSGFVNLCSIVIDKVSDGHCEGHCDIEQKHLNPWGSAHGGLSFTMMDTVAGAALRSVAGTRSCVTLSSNVSYLRPVMPGRAVCTAEVVKNGRKIAIIDAEIHSEEGKLLVRGSFEFCYTD